MFEVSNMILFFFVGAVFIIGLPAFINLFGHLVEVTPDGMRVKRLLWGMVDIRWSRVVRARRTRISANLMELDLRPSGFFQVYRGYFVFVPDRLQGRFFYLLEEFGHRPDAFSER